MEISVSASVLLLTCASISCRLIWVRVMLEKSIVSGHKQQTRFKHLLTFSLTRSFECPQSWEIRMFLTVSQKITLVILYYDQIQLTHIKISYQLNNLTMIRTHCDSLTCLFNLRLPRLGGGHNSCSGLRDAPRRLLQTVQVGAVFVCFYLERERERSKQQTI